MSDIPDDVEIYEDVGINEMMFDARGGGIWQYDCPCGDIFTITRDELERGISVAVCPTCSLKVRVRFNADDLRQFSTSSEALAVRTSRFV